MTAVPASATHNVCSVIVHLAPQHAAAARARIAAMPGVEIVADGEGSRLAVTAIDTADALAIDQVTAMHRTEGVVAVALVYHAMDEADAQTDAHLDAHSDAESAADAGRGPHEGCTCGGAGECRRATHSITPF